MNETSFGSRVRRSRLMGFLLLISGTAIDKIRRYAIEMDKTELFVLTQRVSIHSLTVQGPIHTVCFVNVPPSQCLFFRLQVFHCSALTQPSLIP